MDGIRGEILLNLSTFKRAIRLCLLLLLSRGIRGLSINQEKRNNAIRSIYFCKFAREKSEGKFLSDKE